jgi:hypothetical protein
VVRWLSEQDADGRDRWPERRIGFHGSRNRRGIEELVEQIEDRSRLVVAH